jgi:hypothetical protein
MTAFSCIFNVFKLKDFYLKYMLSFWHLGQVPVKMLFSLDPFLTFAKILNKGTVYKITDVTLVTIYA